LHFVDVEAAMAQAPGRPDARSLVIAGKTAAADGVAVLTLARPSGRRLPDWTPGAHLDLVLPGGLTRQYSLCGDRWDAYRYRVAVLREPAGRGGSGYVHDQLHVGDLVGWGGPRNGFPLVPSQAYLFIAGGIGITPLLPMIAQADLLDADWTLLYAGRSLASMAFLDELSGYGDRVRLAPGDAGGRLDLNPWLGAPRPGVKVYCCGPSRLLDAVAGICAGWPRYSLRTERFEPKAAASNAGDAAFEVELRRSGAQVTVAPGVSVLDAARRAGATVLSSCERGVCGTCETAVVAGRPDHRDSLLDDDERSRGDCMYICVSRAAAGSRLVLDL
jgi:ferredoxin-NADP reductase